MTDSIFEVYEQPYPIPHDVEKADPCKRIADDIQLMTRLRHMLRDTRTEHQQAIRQLLLKLLQVADALERVLAIAPNEDSAAEVRQWNNIRVTRKLLGEALRLQNVVPINPVGGEANLNLCEIESYEFRPDLPDGIVVCELVKGYRWGDDAKPLRLAVVIASRQVNE